MSKFFQKCALGLAAFIFVVTTLVGSLAPLAPAQAVIPVTVDADLPRTASQVFDQIWEGLKTAVLGATARVVAYGLRKVAYDSAVWIASGGKGQSAFAYTRGFGDYISAVGDQAFSQAIQELGTSTGLGNLCKLPDVKLDLALKVGIRTDFLSAQGDPTIKPTCSFQEFSKNWFSGDSWRSQYGGDKLKTEFNNALQVDTNDFGIALETKQQIGNRVSKQTSGEVLQRLEGAGIMPKTGLIAGNIQTPATMIAENFKSITPDKQQTQDQATLQSLIAQGNIRVIPNVLSYFLSTLASTMVKNYQEQGILPFGMGCAPGKANCFGARGSAIDYSGQGFTGNRSAAQQYFQSFLETPQLAEDNKYDVLGDLNNCEGNGLYNCRADSGLVQAVQETNSGGSVTIAEAIKRGLLHGDWKLIPPSRVADNADRNFCQHNYCFSNIQVLRQLRILPLGFEIAAKNSNPDHPWTLKQVVDGFDSEQSCSYLRDPVNGGIIGVQYDSINKPFCRLINPNWVLKLPQIRCAAKAYGSVPLTSGVPDRTEECPDVQNCVAYNADGTCKSFGYCTQEKNTWRFAADTCEAQFATCRTYQDTNGNAFSYLYRTLDTGFCTANTVGCRAYSFDQSASGAWKPVTAPSQANGFAQVGAYFNNTLPTGSVCSPNSAGCSLFYSASTTDSTGAPVKLALKKAPSYLQCYGNYPTGSWPKTTADLNRLNPSPACSQYAQACIPDEQSCNWYKPVFGGTRVPGRFTPATIANTAIQWNDECAAACVGYNAYQELPSKYSSGQPIVYITPPNSINNNSTERVCKREENGCTSFTNLSATQNGLDKIEYYSYLRPCVTPRQATGTVYVTYESSLTGGYQLKSYTLQPDNNGAPKYFYKDNAELAVMNSICSEAQYKAGTADGDCRQFSDPAGTVYYRLLAHTIPVTDRCTPYRLNSDETYISQDIANQAVCNTKGGYWDVVQGVGACHMCYQNGTYDPNLQACTYMGLPAGVANSAGNSNSCSAEVNTCRAYKGNSGNNVKIVFVDTFESANPSEALANWVANAQQSVSAESTQVNGHSIGINGAATVSRTVQLAFGSSYNVEFWVRGTAQNITVSLVDVDSGTVRSLGAVSVGDNWARYELGPADLNGFTSTTARLQFRTAGGNVYLDNISLKQFDINSILYLVKSTLKVDQLCDADQTDNLPGPALGCTAYTRESDNTSIYLTNFASLCREGAIGCTAVFDSYNTPSESGAHTYNIKLSGSSGQVVTGKVGADTYSCEVPRGQTSCYITEIKNHTASEIIAALGAGAITPSTVYIPPDTVSTTPIYLVANQAGSCSVADIGCMLAGVETQTPTGVQYATTTIKNNPGDASYAGMLCAQEAVGCGAFSENGSTVYFKDPTVTGQKLCTYQTAVSQKVCSNNISKQCAVNGDCGNGQCITSGLTKGWFWKDVGVCSADNNTKCTRDADCGQNGVCTNIGMQACYPGYMPGGTETGLYSYGDVAHYQNFVGVCPAEANLCTEFVDHSDAVDASGTPRAYYLIKNDKLSSGDCNGMVNQAAGCALFDQTDNPNKYWYTASLYEQSSRNNQSVQAVSDENPARNDANILLKVVRDRSCAEWLQCRSSHSVYDEKTNKWKEVCDVIGRCDKAQDATNPNSGTVDGCARWVEPARNPYSGNVFSPDMYVNRDVSWAGREFDGYTLLNTYPVDELTMVDAGTSNPQVQGWHLAKTIACGQIDNVLCPGGTGSTQCGGNFQTCGKANNGTCVGGKCVVNIDGTNGKLTMAPPAICRGYPEKDSPYPNTTKLSPTTNGSSQAYSNARFCAESVNAIDDPKLANACECDYTKATYGDVVTKYWSYNNPNSLQPLRVPTSIVTTSPITEQASADPGGICQGGSRDGMGCMQDTDCVRLGAGNKPVSDATGQPVVDGTCLKKNKETKYIGWKGVCVEYDLSRTINGDPNQHPCLTWYPVYTISGSSDIANQHPEAGYIVREAATNVCLKTNVFKTPLPFTYCKDDSGAGACEEKDCDYRDADCPAGYVVVPNYCGQGSIKGIRSCETGLLQQNLCLYTCVPRNSFYKDKDTGHMNSCESMAAAAMRDYVERSADRMSDNDYRAAMDIAFAKAANCITQYAVPYDPSAPGSEFGIYTANKGDYWLGCQVTASVDNNQVSSGLVVPWTNHLWLGSGFNIQSNLNQVRYKYATPNPPFGATNLVNTVQDAWPRLLTSPWCAQNNALNFYLPIANVSDGEFADCAGGSLITLSSSGSVINDSRPYKNITFSVTRQSNKFPDTEMMVFKDVDFAFSAAPADVSDIAGQIFAKVDDSQGGQGKGYQYGFSVQNNVPGSAYSLFNINNSNPAFKYDVREKGPANSGAGSPPTVVSLGRCTTLDNCLEGSAGKITANGVDTGDVIVSNDNGLVTLKFYGYADPDHMPIRNVTIDWGDGVKLSYPGYYQNHRGYTNGVCHPGQLKCGSLTVPANKVSCNSDNDCAQNDPANPYCRMNVCSDIGITVNAPSCSKDADCVEAAQCVEETNAPDFGHIAGTTCDSHYFTYTHVYSCEPGQTCNYIPKVQLTDNWGFCTGACGNSISPGGTACFDGSPNKSNECDGTIGGAYINNTGLLKVKVIP